MPVPGPRNQFGPDPGYRNPGEEEPDRFNRYLRPGPVIVPGRSPGTMTVSLRGEILAPGQIRRLWKQFASVIPAQAPFSWSQNSPAPGRMDRTLNGYHTTKALRYLTRSVYMGAGIDNTRFAGLHTIIPTQVRSKPVSIGGGNAPGRPTVRNRLSSFGSRVPTLNSPVQAAEK